MSVVKINALMVPVEQAATLEQRFAGRAGAVEGSEGFEHFELLRPGDAPVDGMHRYLVYTRWRSEADFEAWQSSQAFSRGHAPGAGEAPQRPAATGAELWSFDVVQTADAG